MEEVAPLDDGEHTYLSVKFPVRDAQGRPVNRDEPTVAGYLKGWTPRAEPSPYWSDGTVGRVLGVHLVFAVTTAVLWIVVLARALRNFASPPLPGPHSAWHKRWGWIAAIDMALTSLSGWVFYWLAFAAT